MARSSKDKSISVRLSQVMLEALDARAVSEKKDRTQVIRDSIAQYLELPTDVLDEKVEEIEVRQQHLDGLTKKLHIQLEMETKRTDNLESKVEELDLAMAAVMKRLP